MSWASRVILPDICYFVCSAEYAKRCQSEGVNATRDGWVLLGVPDQAEPELMAGLKLNLEEYWNAFAYRMMGPSQFIVMECPACVVRHLELVDAPLPYDLSRWGVAACKGPIPADWINKVHEGVASDSRLLDGFSGWFPMKICPSLLRKEYAYPCQQFIERHLNARDDYVDFADWYTLGRINRTEIPSYCDLADTDATAYARGFAAGVDHATGAPSHVYEVLAVARMECREEFADAKHLECAMRKAEFIPAGFKLTNTSHRIAFCGFVDGALSHLENGPSRSEGH